MATAHPVQRYLLLAICVLTLPVCGYSKPYDEFQRMMVSQQPFGTTDLIRASLLLSGVPERDLESYASKFQNYLAEVRSNLQQHSSSEYELGKALLAYLHETRLKRYDSSQSAIHTLFKKGKFNCLSSAVLYLICARSAGLTVEPIGTRDHVLCRVKHGNNWIDVETTAKYGFHPGTRNEFFDEFGRVTGFTYIPPKNYRERKIISELQLLSLLLREQLPEKDPETLRLAIDWYMLAPTEDAHRNLEYASSNYISWLNSKDFYDHALSFVRYYKNRFESDNVMSKSVQALLHKQIWIFIEKKKLDLAEQLLNESRGILAGNLTQTLAENLLAKAMEEAKHKKRYGSVLELASRLTANGYLPKAKSETYTYYIHSQQQKRAVARRK